MGNCLGRDCEGELYAARVGDFVKVGITTRGVEKRVRQLTYKSPVDAVLLWSAAGADGHEEERLLEHLKPFRTRGEWFRYSEAFMERLLAFEPRHWVAEEGE